MASDHSNFFRDNEDLIFQFHHGLKWDEIVGLVEHGFTLPDGPRHLEEARSFYEGALDAVGEYVAKEIAPREAKLDGAETTRLVDGEVVFSPELKAIFDGMRDLGFFGLSIPRELGGMNAPLSLYFLASELVARGDVSVMTHFSFHGGIASALAYFSALEGSTEYLNGRPVKGRFDDIIREIAEGKNFGCMVLTEPGAGSDLGALRTRAVERDGRWRISGEKIFITSGHAQYQLVLAKTEDPQQTDGLKALSLFLVPRVVERDGQAVPNVQIVKLEEKLGHHGSATVGLLYEDSVGELVGARGDGFKMMLALMNYARIGVGFESVGNAEAAFRMARDYAAERTSMGRPLAEHELIAEKLHGMELWIRGLRALGFEALNAAEISQRLELRLAHDPPSDLEERGRLERRRRRLARRARRLTPLFKMLAAEKSVEISRDAVQIFGGMGYIDETGVHKKLRDALVLPIYEGTTQIQALMVTKDHLLAAARDPAGFVRRSTRARLRARTAGTQLERELGRAKALTYGATETVLLRIFGQKLRSEWKSGMKGKDPAALRKYLTRKFLRSWDMRADFAHGLLHAERLARMLADVAIGKMLVRQAGRFPERQPLAEQFMHRALLRLEATAREIELDDGAVLERLGGKSPQAPTAKSA